MTSTHAHDHHAHAHGAHDPGSHGHDHAPRPHGHGPRAQAPAASLLRTSALARLGGVSATLIVLWAGVAWALA
ncbi:ABC-type nickel/cobalt efflux system permease component RcnA [Methylopila capsulata]|uniref:ABC-type nickel/cobalt efflux system permease component RcnA n=1 Tax=Methylopila capsulata TaxID=61654 RepID=A0A9W6IWP5_9HYPH|nr:hypothetical protein [Methylopila capsulata]MBM7852813.1 ABC-type nickel/cobalt efflux system permease component RcnA [Methylopila capsulata]GLK57022.1 hypothetical protein GCM10008170_30410 [Methylopila capsulata]